MTTNKRASVLPDDARKLAGADLLDRLLDQQEPPEGRIQEIDIDQIFPDPDQPRKSMEEEKLLELANSISEVGILQPLTASPNDDGTYRIIIGERRWRAAQITGLDKVPVIVIDPLSDNQRLIRQLIENLHREDFNDIERAMALDALKVNLGSPWDEVAVRVGLTERRVHQLRRLKQLAEVIQDDIRAGKLTEKDSRPYQGLTHEEQTELHDLCHQNHLTTREVDQVAKRLKRGEPGFSVMDIVQLVLDQRSKAPKPKPPGLPPSLSRIIMTIEKEWRRLNKEETEREVLREILDNLEQRLQELRSTLQ